MFELMCVGSMRDGEKWWPHDSAVQGLQQIRVFKFIDREDCLRIVGMLDGLVDWGDYG